MCCFSKPVELVASTKIFARFVGPAQQALVYSMRFAAREDLAMVLPIPVAPGTGEAAVRFVDLSGYPGFFADLKRAFPVELAWVARGAIPAQAGAHAKTLEVHEVGDFEASYVPTVGDFSRLDPRFRLPEQVFDALPEVADFGFAVFKLKGRARLFGLLRGKPGDVHPMAFVFPTRDPERLFFPTLHVHDGLVHGEADFDHTLYAQGALEKGWEDSAGALGDFVKGDHLGLVDPDQPGQKLSLRGLLPNRDQWLAAK